MINFLMESHNKITKITGREILDSRGNPTVEVELDVAHHSYVSRVPSGASTGIYEALELRDEDKSRYCGKGVLKAVGNVNSIIAPALLGKELGQQTAIDDEMVKVLDGTKNEYGWCKSKLGANAILGVSLAYSRATAYHQKIPLYRHLAHLSNNPDKKFIMPVPCFNVINGGKHGENKLAFQEFMVLPVGAKNVTEAIRIGCEVYEHLKKVISKKYGKEATNVGAEGGFAPNIQSVDDCMDLLTQAVKNAGHTETVRFALDVAASEFYEKGIYDLDFKSENNDGSKKLTGEQLMNYYVELAEKYPIISIEDPFDQDDYDSYAKLTAKIGDKVQVVGDDLLVTNPTRITTGVQKKACNALLLKVNQIGTLTESIEAYQTAKNAGWGVMVSHRSGETEDTFIADLVVGLGSGQIKTGAPCRSERTCKYNRLMRIEEELGAENCVYAGHHFRNPYSLITKQE
jgi:enolase